MRKGDSRLAIHQLPLEDLELGKIELVQFFGRRTIGNTWSYRYRLKIWMLVRVNPPYPQTGVCFTYMMVSVTGRESLNGYNQCQWKEKWVKLIFFRTDRKADPGLRVIKLRPLFCTVLISLTWIKLMIPLSTFSWLLRNFVETNISSFLGERKFFLIWLSEGEDVSFGYSRRLSRTLGASEKARLGWLSLLWGVNCCWPTLWRLFILWGRANNLEAIESWYKGVFSFLSKRETRLLLGVGQSN